MVHRSVRNIPGRHAVRLSAVGIALLATLLVTAFGTAANVVAGASLAKEATSEMIPDPEQLGYAPEDGTVVTTSPPSFIWIPVPGAVTYTLEYSSSPDFEPETTHVVEGIDLSVYTPEHALDPSLTWYWRVRPVDGTGRPGAPNNTRSFTIDPAAPEMPLPSMEELRSRIPDKHPRLFVTPETLDAFREKRKSDPIVEEIWSGLQASARNALYAPLTEEPPHARPGGVRDINLWRRYDLAVEATNNAELLAFAYLMSQDEQMASILQRFTLHFPSVNNANEYGEAARRWILHIASWDPYGATSAAVNDEASMPILHKLSRAYTWAYDVLSPEERKTVQDVMRIRGNEAYQILKRRPFESRPYSSHAARQLGFLLEAAIAFMGEIPEAEEWFDYTVRVLWAVYPSWGGDAGGWSEGQAYWASYINRALWFVDVLQTATGLDLYERPFFKNNGYFKLYTHPPYARISPFGDHADRSPGATDSYIMRQYAIRYQNPYFKWYADQLGSGIERGVMGYIRASLRPGHGLEGQPPVDLPPARYFPDVGWVAMHRRLGDRANAVQFMFKSSPYGSWSHSMADQNTFTLEAYGEPLAISSGYRPYYGSEHHMGWTKTTQAHNGILVNGQGQMVQSIESRGQIKGFIHGSSFDYTVGDATEAYQGLLERAVRHVVYIRPDTFVIVDDLLAPEPSQYSWLLHSYYPFEYDAQAGSLEIQAPQAHLQGTLWSNAPLTFEQTKEFAVPLDEPMDGPEQWHFTATTGAASTEGSFLAVLRPTKDSDETRFAAERLPVAAGEGVHISAPQFEAVVLARTREGLLQSERLSSDGQVAAWSAGEGSQGLLLVGGTHLATQAGVRIGADAELNLELTIAMDPEGRVRQVVGSVQAPQAAPDTPVILHIELPAESVQGVLSAALDDWRLSQGTLAIRLRYEAPHGEIDVTLE